MVAESASVVTLRISVVLFESEGVGLLMLVSPVMNCALKIQMLGKHYFHALKILCA